jgi:hypothetical protein
MATEQCTTCKWFRVSNQTCAAFPEGIPPEILNGAVDHTQPYPGDHGIRYAAMNIDPKTAGGD